jgi:hypothetical protein
VCLVTQIESAKWNRNFTYEPGNLMAAGSQREKYAVKTTLGFLTEEGRTRSKNAARRMSAYAALMFLIAGVVGYAIHRYWVSQNLTTLQRIYFKQYLKSSYRSFLMTNSRSHYTTLARIVRDPEAKRDVSLAVLDDDVIPELDEAGRIHFDQNRRPKLLLKAGIEHKKFFWEHGILRDLDAYEWFHRLIYEGKSIPDIWRPAWLGALLIFCFGVIAFTALDAVAQQRYLKGEPIRGTRELLPQAYVREHRKHTGYGLMVYLP